MVNFITASDAAYFTRVCGLIGSIIRNCEFNIIRVYNLGLKADQIDFLNSFNKVVVHNVERVNPHIVEPMVSHFGLDKKVPGLYSWKPVIIKESLYDFDEIFYLDAGVSVVQDLSPIMDYIKESNYFFLKTSDIGWMTTEYVRQKLNLTREELFKPGLNAGIMALNRKTWGDFVLPMSELAKDIELFKDHGTSGGGLYSGRHDQALFSIHALRANMVPLKSQFVINGKNYNVTEQPAEINKETLIYHCRGNSDWNGDFEYIKNFDKNLFK